MFIIISLFSEQIIKSILAVDNSVYHNSLMTTGNMSFIWPTVREMLLLYDINDTLPKKKKKSKNKKNLPNIYPKVNMSE